MLLGMPPLAAVPDVERELDTLYAKPLEEFTKARNDLASRLKRAHQGDVADEVRALRKPSVVAWTANQLARSERDLVHRLLQAGEQLRDVQQRALGGGAPASEVTEASANERDAVRALVVAARGQLGERANAGLLDRLTRTLRAAALDPGAAPLLAAGRLTEELQAVGFGPLEAVQPRRRPDSDEVRRAARDRIAALRADARRVVGEVRDLEQAVEDAEHTAEQLRLELEERRGEAERVATELSAAEDDLRSRR
jgi:hypothetical protein